MTSIPLSKKLKRNLQLSKYLAELMVLTGQRIREADLCSVVDTETLRQTAQKFVSMPVVTCEVSFSEKSTDRFEQFIERLNAANPSPVYVWTPSSIDCGVFLVPSLRSVNFDFDFSINDSGILSFMTNDFKDSLLLDFWEAADGSRYLKIETKGANWANVAF